MNKGKTELIKQAVNEIYESGHQNAIDTYAEGFSDSFNEILEVCLLNAIDQKSSLLEYHGLNIDLWPHVLNKAGKAFYRWWASQVQKMIYILFVMEAHKNTKVQIKINTPIKFKIISNIIMVSNLKDQLIIAITFKQVKGKQMVTLTTNKGEDKDAKKTL